MRQVVMVLGALLACSGVWAQQTQSPPLSFEVASVRENVAGELEGSVGERPGGYGARNVSLRLLVIRAYRLRSFQVVGGADWIDSARFDLNAKAPEGSAPADVFPMLRNLLARRFALQVHTEMRDGPIYALVTARRDGSLGPRLKRSVSDCAPPDDTRDNPCTMSGRFIGSRGTLTGVGQALAQLTSNLATAVGRIVEDRTGLAGLFDFEITWSGGGFQTTLPQGAAPDDGASIFTAVQEQLGLKLEPARGPVEVLVIDSVSRPTPD